MEPLDSAAFINGLLDFASDIEDDDEGNTSGTIPSFNAPAHLFPEPEDEELEWLSKFPTVETFLDGFSGRADSFFKHQSPVSVLENSSITTITTSSTGPFTSCCGGLQVPVRARSKRVRGRRQVGPNDILPHHLCRSGNSATCPKPRPMKMGRKCTHCGAEKTPQWRAGPLGAKTLCNACGVRYKSGRLVPEYRPASSPTFSSVMHSNSHRKVMEMRKDEAGRDPGESVGRDRVKSGRSRVGFFNVVDWCYCYLC